MRQYAVQEHEGEGYGTRKDTKGKEMGGSAGERGGRKIRSEAGIQGKVAMRNSRRPSMRWGIRNEKDTRWKEIRSSAGE